MLPVCEPTLDGNEERYVTDAVSSGWISSSGKYLDKFETEFAEFSGAKYAISCSNGTTALHLAVMSLGIGLGDEVICPDFTIIATSNAIMYTGATPIFVDVDTRGNINPDFIEASITPNTKAIMVVHMYGVPADMDRILDIAEKHGLYVIEDAAQAHGATYKGRPVGTIGNVGAFSFYSNKIISCGEGGMVVTNSPGISMAAKALRNHAFGPQRFVHEAIGYNYRMTNLQAAIGLAQLEKADSLILARKVVAGLYNEHLCGIDGIEIFLKGEPGSVCWMYGILVDKDKFGLSKDELMQELAKKGIETRSFFHPLSLQPIYARIFGGGVYHPNSNKLWREGLYLPTYGHMSVEDIIRVCNAIRELRK